MATAAVTNTFANAVTATGLQLDQNYNALVNYLNQPLNRNNWATDSGNTNTIVLTFSPPVSAYSAGLEITFQAASTNATGGVFINANGLGNQNFIQPGGGELAAGQIESAGIYKAAHNGSAFVFIGQNVLAASQAQMETATSAVTFVSPSTTKYHPGVAKAMAVWVGTSTGTLSALSSYNVAQIARAGTGTYSINFSVNFSSTAFVAIGAQSSAAGAVVRPSLKTVSSVVFICDGDAGTPTDPTEVNFVAYGDQ